MSVMQSSLDGLDWITNVQDVSDREFASFDSDYRISTRVSLYRPTVHGHVVENAGYEVTAISQNKYGDNSLVIHVIER